MPINKWSNGWEKKLIFIMIDLNPLIILIKSLLFNFLTALKPDLSILVPRVWKLYFFLHMVWKVIKLVLVVLKSDQVSPFVSWPLVNLTDWHMNQLKIDTYPPN